MERQRAALFLFDRRFGAGGGVGAGVLRADDGRRADQGNGQGQHGQFNEVLFHNCFNF